MILGDDRWNDCKNIYYGILSLASSIPSFCLYWDNHFNTWQWILKERKTGHIFIPTEDSVVSSKKKILLFLEGGITILERNEKPEKHRGKLKMLNI